eukprot:Gb_07877 [translate_table: standard]
MPLAVGENPLSTIVIVLLGGAFTCLSEQAFAISMSAIRTCRHHLIHAVKGILRIFSLSHPRIQLWSFPLFGFCLWGHTGDELKDSLGSIFGCTLITSPTISWRTQKCKLGSFHRTLSWISRIGFAYNIFYISDLQGLKIAGNCGSTQACAACKYQRRKCSPECPLAPYFPPDQPKQFLNVHKLFGVSNILRILKQLDASQKSDAMKSIVYEAEAWEHDPVHGCFGIITMLRTQVESLKEELDFVRNQIGFIEQQQQREFYLPHQHQLQSFMVSNALPPSWSLHPYANSPHTGFDGQGMYRHCYDMRPDVKLFEYEQRQDFSDSREAYESSAESSLKGVQSLENVPEHELRSAAALFTLTSQH